MQIQTQTQTQTQHKRKYGNGNGNGNGNGRGTSKCYGGGASKNMWCMLSEIVCGKHRGDFMQPFVL